MRKRIKSLIFASLAAPVLLSGCGNNRPLEPEEVSELELEILEDDPVSVRALTENEALFLNTIFGDELDTERISILTYSAIHPSFIGNVLPGDDSNIRIYGQSNSPADFIEASNMDELGRFIFAATKIAQNQNIKGWRAVAHTGENYQLYKVEYQRLTFEGYGPNHQAYMLEDYVRLALDPNQRTYKMDDMYGQGNCKASDALIKLVEDRFPGATELRKEHLPAPERSLTINEKAFAQAIFGDEVDVDQIKVYSQARDCVVKKASVNHPYKMHYWGEDDHSDDFFKDHDPDNFGAFIHELTHNWQRQSGYKSTNERFVNKSDPYSYPLDSRKWSFQDYGVEQQASIIEDYARTFLHRGGSARRNWNDAGKKALKKVVEDRFPQARVTREYYERYGVFPNSTEAITNPKRKHDPYLNCLWDCN